MCERARERDRLSLFSALNVLEHRSFVVIVAPAPPPPLLYRFRVRNLGFRVSKVVWFFLGFYWFV